MSIGGSRVDSALQKQWAQTMLGNYGLPRIELTHGRGAQVWDRLGNQYTDLIAGIAVSALGHGDPRIVHAATEQVQKLAHTSNLFAHEPGLLLARRLLELSHSQGRVLFTQDGATANEAALKLARLHGRSLSPQREAIVATNGSFHGRTMGALAVTGSAAKREPFAPFGFDVRFIDFGDTTQLVVIDESVAAVIIEPVQGEGGVVVPPAGYLAAVRAACDAAGAMLIVDEVQSGIGRTGEWFASIGQGVRPDVITLAKGLAGGFPLGAVIVEPQYIEVLKPGDHGTTFGGNPVSCAVALAVIDAIESDGLLTHVRTESEWLMAQLSALSLPNVQQIRGSGLWLGIVFSSHIASAVESAAFEAGFLVNAVKPDVLRLAPPLNVSRAELQSFVEAMPRLISEVAA